VETDLVETSEGRRKNTMIVLPVYTILAAKVVLDSKSKGKA
jgi:hypothetical protein